MLAKPTAPSSVDMGPRPERSRSAIALELVALAAILAVAVLLRFPGLDQAPPSMTYDEAINGLDIYRIFEGYREPFFPNNNGREGLFIYLQAISVALFGAEASSLRLVSASFGVLSVAATWLLLRTWFGRTVALLGAGILATLFWHVVISRLGLRVNMAPFALALTLWFYWRTLRFGRMRDAVLAGVALGFAQHTYIAARLLPVLLVLLFVAEWWTNRSLLRDRWRVLAVAVVASLVVFAPLGFYLVTHPEDNLTRWSQVVLGGSDVAYGARYSSPLESIPRTLLMFNVHGSEDWTHNLEGRPAFDLVTGAFFLIGLFVAFRQAFGRGTATAGAVRLHPYRWLLATFVVFLIPSAVTLESPHFLRTTIGLPAFVAFPALGVTVTWSMLGRLFGGARDVLAKAAPVAAAGYLALLGAIACYTYWYEWAPVVETWTAHSGLAMAPVEAFRSHFAAGGDPRSVQVIYDTLLDRLDQRLASGDPRADRFSDDERLAPISFLVPQAEAARRVYIASSVYLLTGELGADHRHLALSTDRYELPAEYFDEATTLRVVPAPNGFPAMLEIVVPGDAIVRRLDVMQPIDIDFGDLRLIGASIQPGARAAAGETVTVDLRWRVVEGGNKNFGPSVALHDPGGARWAGQDRQGIVLDRWRPGDEFLSRHRLTVPSDAPPGSYRVEVSAALRTLYPQPSQVLAPLGKPHVLASVEIAGVVPQAPEPPDIGPVNGRQLGSSLVVEQVTPLPESLKPGDDLPLAVRWRLLSGSALPETWLRLLDGVEIVAEHRAGPLPVDGPRSIRLHYPIRIPPSSAASELTLQLAAVEDGGALVTLDLGRIRLEQRPRQMAPAAMPVAGRVDFGDALALEGWGVEQSCSDGERRIRLQLQWHAKRIVEIPYTVFVHVLDSEGRLLGQDDSQPRRGEYPTTAWAPGEYVTDQVEVRLGASVLDTPARVIVGWYDARTGARLPASGGASAGPDFAVLAAALAGCS